MDFRPARPEDIACACATLSRLTPLPEKIASGLTANDPNALRGAVWHLIGAGRTQGLREVVDLLRPTDNFGVFARVQSSRLHRLEGDFTAALADLDELTALFPQRAAPFWQEGRAECLDAMGRAEEAEAAVREGAARWPEDPKGAAILAQWLGRQGRWREAREAWDDALARLGRQPGNDGAIDTDGMWAQIAHARHEARDFEGGEAALAELERRFPDSPRAELERFWLDHWRERGQDELIGRVEAAVARFPKDPTLRRQWTQMLLAQGRIGEAERIVEGLEAEQAGGAALVARLSLEADRGGDVHLRAYAENLARGREWVPDEAKAVADFLVQHRAPWGFDLANEILAGFSGDANGGAYMSALKARVAIRRRDNETACAIIDAIPPARRAALVTELRAWAAHLRGRLDEAQALWRIILRDVFFGALECPIETLDLLSRNLPPPEGGVTAFVVFRNEAPQLPGFLAHHRRLGVRRFVFFDHMSSDDSCALLLKEPDVVLYQSRDSYQFSSSGRRWVAEIVRREGSKGWGLQVDPDEYFIYPGWETTPIDKLVEYLDGRGFAGVRGFMLDMFPRHLVTTDGEPTPLEQHRFYDDDYVWIGQERPPYLSPVGGVRQRLFGATEYLHKTPLWRLDAGEMLNSHETTPLAYADVSSALLHYKLYNMTLRGRASAPQEGGLPYLEADTNLEVLRRHSRYAARLATLWRADLVDPRVSREIGDSLEMTARGLMEASPEYLDWRRA